MAVVFKNNAEGGSPGVAVTTANSGGASGTPWSLVNVVAGSAGTPTAALTYSDVNPLYGSRSYLSQHHDGTTQGNILRWNPSAALAQYSMRHRRRFMMNGVGPASNTVIFQSASGSGTTAVVSLVFASATGRLALQNAAGTITGFGNPLPLDGTPVTIELVAVPGTTSSNGTVRCRWYTTDPNSPGGSFESTSYNAGTAPVVRFNWGRISGTWASLLESMDEFAITDEAAYIGPVVAGRADGSWAFAGQGSGKRVAAGSAPGSWTFAGQGSGKRVAAGSAPGSWNFAGQGSGSRQVRGSAAGGWTFAGQGSGKRAAAGSAPGSWTFAGQGSGSRQARGSAAGSWTFEGRVEGKRSPRASGSSFWATSGQASASRSSSGFSQGSWYTAGAADGLAVEVYNPVGEARGFWAYAGSAAARRAAAGSADSSWQTSAGGAAGASPVKGRSDSAWSTSGQASGFRKSEGTPRGSVSWDSFSEGRRSAVARADGSWVFNSSARGASSRSGSGQGLLEWSGQLIGKKPKPRRDITSAVVSGPSGSNLSVELRGSRTLEASVRGRLITLTGPRS